MINYLIFLFGVVIFSVSFIINAKKRPKSRDKEKSCTNDNSTKTAAQSENTERKTTVTAKKVTYSSKTDFSVKSKDIKNNADDSIQNNETYPLNIISELLINKGFSFQKATVGGGYDEVTHTGDAAYNTQYSDFNDFRDNFESDFEKALKLEREDSNGWVTSLNYGYIRVSLQKQSLSVIVTKYILYRELYVKWTYSDDSDIAYITEINNNIKCLLGIDDEPAKEI